MLFFPLAFPYKAEGISPIGSPEQKAAGNEAKPTRKIILDANSQNLGQK